MARGHFRPRHVAAEQAAKHYWEAAHVKSPGARWSALKEKGSFGSKDGRSGRRYPNRERKNLILEQSAMTCRLIRLSHITFHVKHAEQLARKLVNQFRFQSLAFRLTESSRQYAFKQGSAIFVIQETPSIPTISSGQWPLLGDCGSIPEEFYKCFQTLPKKQEMVESESMDPLYDVGFKPAVDTASNVTFEVENLQSLFRYLNNQGCKILVPPTRIEDDLGCVTYFVVKSVVGNICHTLIDRSQYAGDFLPGFQMIETPGTQAEGLISHFDHITFACPRRSTLGVLEWYEKCFGFKRFQLNSDEEREEGYIIEGEGLGLRLAAMQYWKCSKVGLSLSSAKDLDCKFVIAESLPEQGRNQVDTFLEQHGGAGIQHVGLYTPNIIAAAKTLRDANVLFVNPPPDYYSEAGKEGEIHAAGEDPYLLSQLGVLLDSDLNGSGALPRNLEARKQYLMQVFTQPIFSEETFFLELIQRHGASGFGEGNIRALWRAMQVYISRQAKVT